ncbi:MAG: hypothetical protein H0T76_20285 [Nannocystis sp.]|nr:hypothetical protein [Nannocystis sp.]MBA3548828.1 hypothetical protein [Nannocystis sp.]
MDDFQYRIHPEDMPREVRALPFLSSDRPLAVGQKIVIQKIDYDRKKFVPSKGYPLSGFVELEIVEIEHFIYTVSPEREEQGPDYHECYLRLRLLGSYPASRKKK